MIFSNNSSEECIFYLHHLDYLNDSLNNSSISPWTNPFYWQFDRMSFSSVHNPVLHNIQEDYRMENHPLKCTYVQISTNLLPLSYSPIVAWITNRMRILDVEAGHPMGTSKQFILLHQFDIWLTNLPLWSNNRSCSFNLSIWTTVSESTLKTNSETTCSLTHRNAASISNLFI